MALPTADDVRAAAERLRGIAVRTPLVRSEVLDARTGGRVYLKAEPLQRTGSFKFRGAYNTIAQLEAEAVVAYSSGNHAQGVAAAARLRGLPATIVMPADAPAIKIARTRGHGAEVRLYDRATEDREAIAGQIAAQTGAELIRPYDDPRIIAGQGTVGLEAAEDLRALGITPDLAVVCCGGGGLVAGVGLALRDAFPEVRVFTAEPLGFDSMARSLAAGARVTTPPGGRSICDALLAPRPGELTFRINQRQLAGGVAVTDDAVREAMAVAFAELKLVVEPGGAVALAAILAGHLETRGRTVLVVLSGGNVDPALFAAAIAGARSDVPG